MKITKTEKSICIESQYNPDLPPAAKRLGGKWDPSNKVWAFDLRDEERVAELYRGLYGEWPVDGEPAADMVVIRVTFTDDYSEYHGGIFFSGRQLARARGRDSGATLAPGVIVLEGGFYSCGSVKNWKTGVDAGTVVEIRDFPLSLLEKEKDNPLFKVEVIVDVDRTALETERERLVKRIAEIDEMLLNI